MYITGQEPRIGDVVLMSTHLADSKRYFTIGREYIV